MKKNDVEEMIKPEGSAVKTKSTKKVKEPKASKVSSDAKVIMGIVGGMILVCAALIFYYFFGINNQTVATYEGGKVTRGEYELYYKLFQPMLTYYGYPEETIKEEVLNKVVIDKIVVAKANSEGVTISDEDKEEIDELFADEDEVSQYVEQGIDPVKMKKVYYDDALINTYIEKRTAEATEEEIKAFIDENEKENANYDKYVTSYILYSNEGEGGDLEKVKANAEATLTRIKNGEGFATVGEEVYDADSYYTQYGSDYEVYLNGTTVEAYEEAVRNMKVGETTQELVLSEEYGYFIITVTSIEENARISGEDAADNYVNELMSKWQANANIVARDKKIDSIAAKLTTSTSSN